MRKSWTWLFKYSMSKGLEYCRICSSSENLTFDHILPRSKCGTSVRNNITILCQPCNLKKDDRHYSWLESLEHQEPIGWMKKSIDELCIGDVTVAGTVTNINFNANSEYFTIDLANPLFDSVYAAKTINKRQEECWVFIGANVQILEKV